jgi:hypothetical protein
MEVPSLVLAFDERSPVCGKVHCHDKKFTFLVEDLIFFMNTLP